MYAMRIFEIQEELMGTQIIHLHTVFCKVLKPLDYSF